MKKAGKVILIILLSVLAVWVIGVVFLWIKSPGRLDPLTDPEGKVIPNSLSERVHLEIGGIEQGFFIRGENPDNPVILFLHGGPGSPELPMVVTCEKEERLEKYFTVCYWDQRGAGMSYHSSLDPATLTVAQMVEDTREMTRYLQERFGQEKIFLMGHSWGSYLGIKVIEKYPELYRAFIGIGQVTDQLQSEKIAYDHMLQLATEQGNSNDVRDLKKYDKNAAGFPTRDYLLNTRTLLMNKYGIGIMHNDFSMGSLVKDILFFRGYTLSDKSKYIRGNALSLDHVFYYVIEDNLFHSSPSFEVPVYITHGKYDYQVSYTLAKHYYDTITAPKKGFFTFENSAHSPNLEEPENFVRVVRQIATEN